MKRRLSKRYLAHGAPIWLVLPALLVVGCFFILPLIALVLLSLQTNSSGGPTLANYAEALTRAIYRVTFARSVGAALACTTIAMLIGYPFAHIITRWSRPLRLVSLLVTALPLALNLLVSSFAWIVILQRKGVINTILMRLGLVAEPIQLLFTWPATISGMVYVVLPLMILPIYSNLSAIDQSYTDAARTLGAPPTGVFWRITLPLSMPGVVAGALLVFVASFGLYLVPDLLGGPQFTMLPFLIQQQTLQFLNWPMAAALSILLLGIVVPLALLGQAQLWNNPRRSRL